MASYHSSFKYLDKNSLDEGFIICAFEQDDGLVDSFLSMEQVYTDSYDRTKRFLYGTKYDSVATINITIIKSDGSAISVEDNRKVFRWLTGYKKASWLDLYEKDVLKYSFYCTLQNIQQYKLDARVIGFTITFESVHPWAWSAPQRYNCYFDDHAVEIDSNGVLFKSIDSPNFGFSKGVAYNDTGSNIVQFNIDDKGVVYNSEKAFLNINNQTDDLYTYMNLNMEYNNVGGHDSNSISINNLTLQEETVISGMKANETVLLNEGQFIISDIPNKIFGDTFNFVWPRLIHGMNRFEITGMGKGYLHFSYRHPIKIGDCAIDVANIDYNTLC